MSHRLLWALLASALTGSGVGAAEPTLSIDTPVLQLIANPSTKVVLEKHLPKLVKRLAEDQEAAAFFGSSSPRELAADPHVRGITEEILNALQAELLAAQSAN
ncbi:MAG TPA: hypothetical protein VFO36_00735 [Nitrospiraceae bacterium]|nr:hypothetical protein [Nitrospiraceae bacterium]